MALVFIVASQMVAAFQSVSVENSDMKNSVLLTSYKKSVVVVIRSR